MPFGLRPSVMPNVPGSTRLTFSNHGATSTSSGRPPIMMPATSAPAALPMPPTTPSSSSGRLCTKAKFCGLAAPSAPP